jgi:ATP-binding protein involved in chromosome partitioning
MPLPLYQDQQDHKSPSLALNPLASVQAIVAIAAGKGGVGKSSITVNLALALKAQGYQVGIMDTDIYGPSIRKMLPEDDLPTQKGSLIQPALCKGIKMISMAYFRQEGEATAVRAPIANGLIAHFIHHVQWGKLDFLLVDFPPGTGDVQLTLSQQAHLIGALMVTTPQEVALLDVRKAMSLFEQVKVPMIGIIENMSYYQSSDQTEPVYLFGRGGGERLAIETGAPFLGHIPLDPLLCTCGDQGQSLLALDPAAQRPVTRAFQQLAQQFVRRVASLKVEKQQGLSSFELVWKEIVP